MIRNPQILGTCANRLCRALLVTLCAALGLGACGLKGPLYLPVAASAASAATPAVTPASAPAAASSNGAAASAPSTPNSPAR
ncbi:lipoprotein [Aquabacterium sp.]|uniref:LPS translocon maturation chaperone LptM n=1 Tax=Aquabacterium sp. TaxID=1872578 RepID=UPI0035C70F62